MTITRIWHGYTTPERADDYEALLKAEVIKGIESKDIPGFRRIDVLRRPLGDEVEFITAMEFDSIDSVKAFVGEDYEQAYVPDEARAILSRFDERSQHYEQRDSRTYGEDVADVAPTLAQPVEEPAERPQAPHFQQHPILPDGAWFVKKDGSNGSAPVTRDGFRVVLKFVIGIIVWAVITLALAAVAAASGTTWLSYASPVLFAAGALLLAWYFVRSAKKHTDYSITYSEYLKARNNA